MNLKRTQRKLINLMAIISSLSILMVMMIAMNTPSNISASVPTDTATYLPIILNNADNTLGIPLFGIQTYNDTRPTNKYYTATVESHASWVRTNISWAAAQPISTSVDYNWTQMDNSLSISSNPNIHVIATIEGNPGWTGAESRGIITGSNLLQFSNFVHVLVERYDGDGVDDADGSPIVTYWEFYNEPDLGGVGSWGDRADLYAAMLQTIYPIVKQANPNTKVVLGGIAYDAFYEDGGTFNRDFLDGVLEFGGGYFDVMNFHSYPAFSINWTPLNGPGLLQKTEAVRDKLTEYGYGDREIIITESGWYRDTNTIPASSPAIQSYYVIKLFTQSYAADVDVMIWWMLFDPGSGYYLHGLVTNDTPPVIQPSFVAYQTAVSELSTAHFKRAWTPQETGSVDIEVYEFEDNVHRRKIYVAWINPANTGVVSAITIPGEQATTVKVSGFNVIETPYTGASGSILIPISAQPIFIEVDR